jgi:hypothetical protein
LPLDLRSRCCGPSQKTRAVKSDTEAAVLPATIPAIRAPPRLSFWLHLDKPLSSISMIFVYPAVNDYQ